MTETAPSPSARFVAAVEAAVRDALTDLNRQEAEFAQSIPAAAERESGWVAAVNRLEGNLSGWQTILGDMADRVRVAQEDLAALDADLNRALASFATARKYLEGEPAA
jgi:hypothetical protein